MYITTAVSIIMTIIFIIYLLYIFGSIFPRSGTVRNRPEQIKCVDIVTYRRGKKSREKRKKEREREAEIKL